LKIVPPKKGAAVEDVLRTVAGLREATGEMTIVVETTSVEMNAGGRSGSRDPLKLISRS
jgi:hypothetical protein